MQYAVSDVNHHDRYKILTAFVLPRPIAWVTTLGPTGTVNAAPFSFFNVFAPLSDEEAVQTALGYWNEINLPNLEENVLPTKHRATLVLQKTADHTVERVLLRKV